MNIKSSFGRFVFIPISLLVLAGPILVLYLREYQVASAIAELCLENEGVVLVNKGAGKRLRIEGESGESRVLWRELFRNPEMEIAANIIRGSMVKEKGEYLLRSMNSGSSECTTYGEYVNSLSPQLKRNIERDFSEFTGSCIGIIKVDQKADATTVYFEDQFEPYKSGRKKIHQVRRLSMRETGSDDLLAYVETPVVERSSMVFEFSRIFDFQSSCTYQDSTKYHLISKYYE